MYRKLNSFLKYVSVARIYNMSSSKSPIFIWDESTLWVKSCTTKEDPSSRDDHTSKGLWLLLQWELQICMRMQETTYLWGIHRITSGVKQSGDRFFYNKFPHIFLCPCRRSSPELVFTLLGRSHVASIDLKIDVTEHFGIIGSDDARVDVWTWAEIVEDTGWDGVEYEIKGFLSLGMYMRLALISGK